MVDIPHQIINPPSIQRNVQVVGGTNWDLSRSAVQTPIQQLPDPEPIRIESDANWSKVSVSDTLPAYTATDNIPKGTPTRTFFESKKSAVSKRDSKVLRAMSKLKAFVVVGHASQAEASPSTLSWARANEVANVLRRSGHKVKVVKAFSTSRPASLSDIEQNARVEVYAVAK